MELGPKFRAGARDAKDFGHELAESTVAKYMGKTRDPKRQQTWRTSLRNHLDVSASCDFFTVATLSFKLLYVFVVQCGTALGRNRSGLRGCRSYSSALRCLAMAAKA